MFFKNKLNLLNSQNRHVRLRHLLINDTGLQTWDWSRFTVMSSGEDVVWGKTSDETPPAFHIFSLTSTGWKKLRNMKRLCDHDCVNILPVNIKNKEQIAVSCLYCQSIKLYSLDTLQVTTAFHNPQYYPSSMCHGENVKLYVVHAVEGAAAKALELGYSEEAFSRPNKIIQSGMNKFSILHYIPSPHKVLIFPSWKESIIRAVSVETGEMVWEVKGKVDGKTCEPHGALYSSHHQALLIADGENCRVLVLHPRDGSHLQTIQLDREIVATIELRLHQNKVILWHRDGNQEKISYFAIH